MAIKVTSITRVFKYNGVTLPDPGHHLTPEGVRDMYSAAYPEIVTAAIEGPEIKGNKEVYEFRRVTGTKG